MTFTRSSSSLYGIHRFYQADVVVFCEGGASLTYSEAIRYSDCSGTLDTLYWSSIVSRLGVQKTFHFKSVGGKLTIDALADEVRRLTLTTVTVCRDSDYDRRLGRNSTAGRIAWTMGYSWENDVVQTPVLEGLAESILGVGADREAAITEIRAAISQFERDLPRWTEIDISLCARGKPGMFERAKPLAAIDMTSPPNLRTVNLTTRLANAGHRRKPPAVLSVSAQEALSICFGKLVSRALYHTFVNAIRPYCEVRLDYELFMRLAIREMIVMEAGGRLPLMSDHITNQRAAFA